MTTHPSLELIQSELTRAESDPRLYLFSSDYPHAEGGRDPLGRFERSWAGTPAGSEAVTGFFAGNAATWLGVAP